VAASQAAEAVRGRPLLVELLAPGWPGLATAAARQLIDTFGSLPAIFAAAPEALARCIGESEEAEDIARFLGAIRGAMVHSLRREAASGPLLPDIESLIDYLHLALAHLGDEEFRVFYLNARNVLIREETVATGIPNEVAVHPRMIMKRALELGATALILVHNHPSGSPDPSEGDLQTTARIVRAARTLDIVVHDHIIIASGGWRSFRRSGLLV